VSGAGASAPRPGGASGTGGSNAATAVAGAGHQAGQSGAVCVAGTRALYVTAGGSGCSAGNHVSRAMGDGGGARSRPRGAHLRRRAQGWARRTVCTALHTSD
jgi:hypothetical protein